MTIVQLADRVEHWNSRWTRFGGRWARSVAVAVGHGLRAAVNDAGVVQVDRWD